VQEIQIDLVDLEQGLRVTDQGMEGHLAINHLTMDITTIIITTIRITDGVVTGHGSGEVQLS
jgi:hypothetical protein